VAAWGNPWCVVDGTIRRSYFAGWRGLHQQRVTEPWRQPPGSPVLRPATAFCRGIPLGAGKCCPINVTDRKETCQAGAPSRRRGADKASTVLGLMCASVAATRPT
jgi:hypothetical protein